jgi:DNA-binding IclR family transcriptional regulator
VVLPLAYSYLLSNEVSQVSLPVLQELATASQETASLFVRIGHQRVVVQRVEGAHPLRYVLPIGRRLPLHMGVGKALAAWLPIEEQKKLVQGLGIVRYAKGDTILPEALLEEFAAVKKLGYAVSMNEREMGVASVAAPVFDSSGNIAAAISVAGSSSRIESKLDSLIVEVSRAAASVTERLSRL